MLINRSKLILGLYFLLLFALGCTRSGSSSESSSVVVIETPKRGSFQSKFVAQGQSLPTDKRVCYAVNVSGSGISGDMSNACIKEINQVAGFVTEGESLTLSVTKGSGRKFQVYVYLTDINSSCPSWDDTFKSQLSSYDKLYKVSEVTDVNLVKDEETLEMSIDFPGIENSIGLASGNASCVTAVAVDESPTLRSLMLSSGVAVAKTDASSKTILSYVKAYWQSMVQLVAGSFLQSEVEGVSSTAVLTSSGTQVSPYLRSITKKLDSGLVYGLDDTGQIYQIGSDGKGTSVGDSNCPFTRCKVPVWVQSISAGKGTALYALDHSGTIYKVTASDLEPISDPVNMAVTQVIFY